MAVPFNVLRDECLYSGTLLMRTPLGPTQSVLIRGVALYQGLFSMHKIHSGPRAVSALQWMSAFQGCPQGRIPLYLHIKQHVHFGF